jgi:hypothetical protein
VKKNDFRIIIGILIIAGIFYMVNQYRISKMDPDTLFVKINVNGKLYEKVSLNEEKEFRIETEHGYNIIKVHDNGVEMLDANCPDKICVRTEFIDKAGSTIVCLPHKIYVEIISNREDEIDEISE